MRIHVHCIELSLPEAHQGPGRCRINGPGPTIATITGDLDTPAIGEFTAGIEQAISDAHRTLIVDLTRIDFVSISGIEALADTQHRAECRGLAMLLVPDGPTCTRALKVTGLEHHFRCFDTVRDAVEARRAELAAHTGLDHLRTSSRRQPV
ncbi:STAS domain-containing protein [Rhodococcus sp. NPDC003318]|uniref:STAS domain-containing protein n=1 Tax=Rhodococcus sp. NPDC003318 TaxID=3364503 RepID=UPI0036D1BE6D